MRYVCILLLQIIFPVLIFGKTDFAIQHSPYNLTAIEKEFAAARTLDLTGLSRPHFWEGVAEASVVVALIFIIAVVFYYFYENENSRNGYDKGQIFKGRSDGFNYSSTFNQILDFINAAQMAYNYNDFDFQNPECQPLALCNMAKHAFKLTRDGDEIEKNDTTVGFVRNGLQGALDSLKGWPVPSRISKRLQEYRDAIIEGFEESTDCERKYSSRCKASASATKLQPDL